MSESMSTEEFGYSTKQHRLISNIRTTIKDTLVGKYGISESSKRISLFQRLHGLHPDNFDAVARAEDMFQQNINDVSIDDNSNKEEKFIKAIMQEVNSPNDKIIGFDYLYRTMKTLYGKEEAKRLSGELYDLSLGLSDSTNIMKPYCWAADASKLIYEGRPWGQLPSEPSKHMHSYISALTDTIHEMSNHLAGAIAIGSFFFDIAHILIHKEGYALRHIREEDVRKYIDNEFQQFIWSVNHLSRDGAQSPFTNVSIFDTPKNKNLIKDMNHLFPVIEDIETAKYGMDFSKYESKIGSEISLGTTRKLGTDEDVESTRTYTLDDAKMEATQDYYVEFVMELQEIYMDLFEKGDQVNGGRPFRFPVTTVNFSKHEDYDVDVWSKKADECISKGEPENFIKDAMEHLVLDPEFILKFVENREVYRYNIFTSKGTKVASCCRMINDDELMEEFGASSNSFGGSGVSLGSHRVVTINYNRIALECQSLDDFWKIYDERIEDAAKVLKAHKELIQMLHESGHQPFIKRGWVNMKRLFSTFGIMGLYEADKNLRERFDIDPDADLTGEFLEYLNQRMIEVSHKYGIAGNIEQIPGESFAVRLATADRMIFGEKAVPQQLYANQFVPLWEDATLWEKMKADGKYNQKVTGGGIVHAQISEEVTPNQALLIILYSIASGCEHFALNSIYSVCENNHSTFGKHEKCPQCGAQVVDLLTRVVGFFTKVSSWNPIRKVFEFPKRTFASMGIMMGALDLRAFKDNVID